MVPRFGGVSDLSLPPDQFEFPDVSLAHHDALRRTLVSVTQSVGAVAHEAIADISRFQPRPTQPDPVEAAPSAAGPRPVDPMPARSRPVDPDVVAPDDGVSIDGAGPERGGIVTEPRRSRLRRAGQGLVVTVVLPLLAMVALLVALLLWVG